MWAGPGEAGGGGQVGRPGCGQHRPHGIDRVPVHGSVFGQGLGEQVQADTVLAQQAPANPIGGGEVEHGGQVIRKFAVDDLQSSVAVHVGEAGEGLAPAAGVTRGVVRQVQAASPAKVEQRNVLDGQRVGVGGGSVRHDRP
jgi:hypothetical protein